MKNSNLEEKINARKGKFAVGIFLLANLAYSCTPSASLPVDIVTKYSITCCETLRCTEKGYDYCRDDGKVFKEGVYQQECSCHDNTPVSKSDKECTFDSDCMSDERCSFSRCVADYHNDCYGCASNEHCVNGTCVPKGHWECPK